MKKIEYVNLSATALYCDLADAQIKSCLFGGSTFFRVDFRGSVFLGCNFNDAIFEDCKFKGAIFCSCHFEGAKWQGGDFEAATLKDCTWQSRIE